jgi:hypothetical protein
MKVGDKVKVVDGSYYDTDGDTVTGMTGKVVDISRGCVVLFDVYLTDDMVICFEERELEVIQ